MPCLPMPVGAHNVVSVFVGITPELGKTESSVGASPETVELLRKFAFVH